MLREAEPVLMHLVQTQQPEDQVRAFNVEIVMFLMQLVIGKIELFHHFFFIFKMRFHHSHKFHYEQSWILFMMIRKYVFQFLYLRTQLVMIFVPEREFLRKSDLQRHGDRLPARPARVSGLG